MKLNLDSARIDARLVVAAWAIILCLPLSEEQLFNPSVVKWVAAAYILGESLVRAARAWRR